MHQPTSNTDRSDKLVIGHESKWRPTFDLDYDGRRRPEPESGINEVKLSKKRIHKPTYKSGGRKHVQPYEKKIKVDSSTTEDLSEDFTKFANEFNIKIIKQVENVSENYDKKIYDNFQKGEVVYGSTDAVKKLLNHQNSFDDDLNGVILNIEEISLSKKTYVKDVDFIVVQEKLGEGAVGIVSLLQDTVTKKQFVSKQMKQTNFKRKEAEVMLALKHPNITSCFGVIFEMNKVEILMSYSGISIQDLIKNKTPFNDDDVIDYSISALSALHYLHDNYLIHMDIKPSNVCICMETKTLFLTDFGSTLTPQETLEFQGVTPPYMSPEVCLSYWSKKLEEQGHRFPVDPVCGKADVYSWALTMRFMLERQHTWYKIWAFTGNPINNGTIIQTAIQHPEFIKNDLATNNLNADFKEVIVSLLEGQPKNRPTAEEGMVLLQDIQRKRLERREVVKRPVNQVNDETRLRLRNKLHVNEFNTPVQQPSPSPEIQAPAALNCPNFGELF